MTKNSKYENHKLNLDSDYQESVIGLYEMLAQAQPDITNNHSSIVDLISEKIQSSRRSNE
ncbi:MAG: hypothetical protein P8M50_02555 [Paracoccaceae bacterium]|nr:hypothetical protein [Paracoccaceae bacterium]